MPPDALALVESEGGSWYNGLETSLTKRLSKGLQFLASYTFSKTLDSDHDQLGVDEFTPGQPPSSKRNRRRTHQPGSRVVEVVMKLATR